MVRSGETSGRLEESLDRVAFQLEKMDALRRQVRSAMLYPAFIFVAAMAIMLAIVIFIVPVFADAFKEAVADQPGESADLPAMTQITIGISHGVTGLWFIWIPAVIGGAIGFIQWRKNEWGRHQWDRIKLHLPFHIGDVVQKVAIARWSRTFSGSVSSGVPILQSINLVGQTSGNVLVERAMNDVYESVKGGGTIAHPIEKCDVFPPMVGHMVAVGEETGQLEQMLTKIADFYEQEVDTALASLTSAIEPVMIVFLGGAVGFIVIAMFMPLVALIQGLSGGGDDK
jgi:type IV pilus assembly protein PilC